MLITLVEVDNYKRLEHVRIEPEADRVLLLIGGKNAQGKTSTMDALSAAFGGKTAVASDPVRHGADEAEIFVELDGGKLSIKRVIKPDGAGALEVREEGVKVRSPQALLDKIIGERFLDPLDFLRKPPKDQRALLLTLVAGADRLAELDRKRLRAFDKRTEVARDLKKAEAQLEGTSEVKPGKAIDVAALTLESSRISDALRERATVVHAEELAAQRARAANAEVEKLRRLLADAEAASKSADEAWLDAQAKVSALPPADEKRREEILFELRRAQDHNAKVDAAARAQEQRKTLAAEIESHRKAVVECETVIARVDERKREILASTPLPVDGLGFTDDEVTLNGVPLSQASGAERLRVALGLAIAASPTVRDVWVRDGALLDEDSLAAIEQLAAAAGARCWIERVGTSDTGAIVIHDGKVVEP